MHSQMLDTLPAAPNGAARAEAMPVISVVAPVYSDEALLPEFARRTVATLAGLGEPFEAGSAFCAGRAFVIY